MNAINKYQITGKISDAFTVIGIIFFITEYISPCRVLMICFQIPCKDVEMYDQSIVA